MENNSKAEIKRRSDDIQKKILGVLSRYDLREAVRNDKTMNDLNTKILKITTEINDQYPELSKYLEEMPIMIPDEKKPEITLKNMVAYYDSLNSMLNNYITDHPTTKPE